MPKEVSPQVDIGLLTLNGLAAFTPVLAALTTDNVQPMAMVQLENLGSLFHTSGKYAAKAPDLLRRCHSKRIEHLSMSLGWRKGDAASVMSQSAGGQAMALLCLCLRNLYNSTDCGEILFALSGKVLQKDLKISSVSQLADVADILSGKMQALGFGNILAEQTIRIHKIFEQLQKPVAPDFLNTITKESMVDILASLSRAFCEERTIVRISGSGGMGYIVALAAILFPFDTTLIIDDLVVSEGIQRLVYLEFKDTTGSGVPTQVEVEKVLDQGHSDCFPITVMPNEALPPRLRFFFRWEGHVADALSVLFSDFGIVCTSALLIACCDLLITLPAMIPTTVLGLNTFSPGGAYSGNVLSLLGPEPIKRLHHVCRLVLRETPSGRPKSLLEAFNDLVQTFTKTVGTKSECTCEELAPSEGFFSAIWFRDRRDDNDRDKNYSCGLHSLWRGVLGAVSQAFWSIFVDADANAVVEVDDASILDLSAAICDAIYVNQNRILDCTKLSGYDIHKCLFSMMSSQAHYVVDLAISNGSSALVPRSLLYIKRGLRNTLLYELRDGQIMVNGRYYCHVRSDPEHPRAKSNQSLSNVKGPISPSSLGAHSDLVLTVRELADVVKLRATATCQGQSVRLDLTDIISSSVMVLFSEPCKHDPDSALDEALCRTVQVITTSVAAPNAADNTTIAITQTKGNPVAQLLACENYRGSLLQCGCCLTCAVKQARYNRIRQVIAG